MSIVEIYFTLKPMKFKKSYCAKQKRYHKREDFPSNRGEPFCYWCGKELIKEGRL